jgi:tetratricopeptide (TPR) repeat protein
MSGPHTWQMGAYIESFVPECYLWGLYMPQDSGALAQASAREPPTIIAERYGIVRLLGRGGMGAVYEVMDERTGRRLALKRMLQGGALRNAVSLFEQEFHVLAGLAHPSIVSVFDYGIDEEGPFYTMELLDGADILEHGAFPWQKTCAVLRDVASALGILHSRRLLHGDLSGRNVRLDAGGRAKLIDFGTMTPMGVPKMVAGTPPFLAPEALAFQSLDARADLFSFGALAYRMLAGVHAFPARTLRDLPVVWKCEPRSPKHHSPDVPEALAELVIELLNMDRMARPSSAAVVIERLCTIADLPRDEKHEIREAYLAMPALVGRDAAVAEARAALAGSAHGVALVIEGDPGVGRSRLLDACVLEAKLLGRSIFRAGGRDGVPGDYAVARSLASQIFRELPELAHRAARPRQALLSHVMDGLVNITPDAQRPEPERRQVTSALRDWLLGIAGQRPLVLAIDDFDCIDEPSAAFLATLPHTGQRHDLSLVVSMSPRPAAATAKLVQAVGRRLLLAPLNVEETEALLCSVFGETDNVALVARQVHELSNGNPRGIMDLAQGLVDRGLARHEAGGWVLPRRLGSDHLPSEASLARFAAISDAGRELVEVLSLTDPLSVPLAEYPELLGNDHAATYRAVLELLAAFALVPVGDRYRLSHRGFASIVAAQIEPRRRVEFHARLARLKERQNDAFGLAHHLLEAGETRRAVDVVRANRKTKAFVARPETTAFLERLILESEALGVPRAERISLAVALVGVCALFGDHERFQRHARPALSQLKRDSGLDDWYELAAEGVPEEERLARAFERVEARYAATPDLLRGLPGQQAFMLLARMSSHFSSMATVSMDATLVLELPSFLPFAALSPAISVLDESLRAAREFLTCHGTRARALALSVVARTRQSDFAGLGEAAARSLRFAMLYMLGAMDAFDGLPDALSHVSEFEGTPQYRSNAWRVRRVAHLLQGDFEDAAECHRRAETFDLMDGQEQAFPGTVIRIEASAHWMVGNIAGLKEAIERIAELATVFPGWQSTLETARCHYLRLRGDPSAALEEIMPALSRSKPGQDPDWPWVVAAHVSALTAAGRYEEGARTGLEYYATARREELEPAHRWLVKPVSEALARAGRLEEARALCDESLRELEAAGVRGLWLGLLYEARAFVAASAGDDESFQRDAARCADEYRRGKSSTLIASYERLMREAARLGGTAARAFSDVASRREAGVETHVAERSLSRLSGCCSREERLRYLLAALMDHAGADVGYLYVVRSGKLEQGAVIPEHRPPDDGLESLVEASLKQQLGADEMTATFTIAPGEMSNDAALPGLSPSASSGLLSAVPLMARRGGETVVTAIAALRFADGRRVLDGELLNAVATSLLDHDDADALTCS